MNKNLKNDTYNTLSHWQSFRLKLMLEGNKEIIPKGNTEVYSGDQLLVLVNEDKAAWITEELQELGRALI